MPRIQSWRRNDPHAENIEIGNGTVLTVLRVWGHDGLSVIPIVECIRNRTKEDDPVILGGNAITERMTTALVGWYVHSTPVNKSWKDNTRAAHQFARHDH